MEATKANESIKGAAFIVNETAAQERLYSRRFQRRANYDERIGARIC